MITPFVFPSPNGLLLEAVSWEKDTLLLHLRSSQAEGTCPGCHQVSVRVHSRYMRTLADLPCQAQMVRLRLQVRRFFCDKVTCPRKTFAEPFPALTLPYARRTERLANVLREVAFALGGKPGAHLAKKLQMPASLHTLLRLIRRSPCPHPAPPRVVGIDEWAWRKGRRYGTILCDLERHIPLDLLPDREADSVIAWLQRHPSVEIVSRDRSTEYADAARRGAPQALQVADRFHLIKNLGEALEPLLDRNKGCLRFMDEPGPGGQASLSQPPVLSQIRPAPNKKAEKVRLAQRQERLNRYEQAIALRKQGFKIADIATHTGVHRRTIERFLAAPGFPEKKRRRAERTKLEAYHSHLWQRWQAGVHNASHLFREIAALGY
ncbi:MAG: ISL3 family transposase, partial [Ktedonobacteraceae bacterium]|nr:ISL3 family transposase [Ktedonobacteraceae bacterium]